MFSIEIPKLVRSIESQALGGCYLLRNVAISPKAMIEEGLLPYQLQKILGLDSDIIKDALKHQFDGLPIHKILYYQSHQSLSLDNFNDAMRLNPSGNKQDCLGMTALHVACCTNIEELDMYNAIIAQCTANLITEDRWGSLSLLYALWANARIEVVQLLLKNYRSHFPGHKIDWSKMVETLVMAKAPREGIQNLLEGR
jgi:hypothetical protein